MGTPPPPPPPGQQPQQPPGFGQPPTPPGYGQPPAYGTPPPPQFPQWSQPPPAGAPAGYVPDGAATGPTQPAATGARKAIGVLMWVTVAANALFALAAFSRKSVFDGYVNGDKSYSDVDDADSLIGLTVLVVLGLTLAVAIVLAVWSSRAANNARARGASPSPGLAAGGWFIPIGWYVVPFVQLRKALGGRGRQSLVTSWQVTWTAGTLLANGLQRVFGDIDATRSASDASDRLRNQGVVIALGTIALAIATVFATRAMRHVDEVTSGTTA